MEKTQVWRYGASVVGVRNRCRNVERHVTSKKELGFSNTGEPDAEISKALAKAWAEKNFKTVQKVTAKATLWTIDGDSEQWELFTKEHNLSWPVEYTK